ncbi:hypothetical protein ABZ815_20990 [Nonomuraea sp. NPDC047529]|uniref:hypothetical protein n=1 Tax=Nonomuraea sp. NPDC047529 TaxID=3155623 RepID=UPI0034009C57
MELPTAPVRFLLLLDVGRGDVPRPDSLVLGALAGELKTITSAARTESRMSASIGKGGSDDRANKRGGVEDADRCEAEDAPDA